MAKGKVALYEDVADFAADACQVIRTKYGGHIFVEMADNNYIFVFDSSKSETQAIPYEITPDGVIHLTGEPRVIDEVFRFDRRWFVRVPLPENLNKE